MEAFYISAILVGMCFMAAAIALVRFDRKKSADYLNKMDTNKEELVGIISDAEQMVQELNRFSDFVVERIESKNTEFLESMKNVEEHIQRMKSDITAALEEKALSLEEKALLLEEKALALEREEVPAAAAAETHAAAQSFDNRITAFMNAGTGFGETGIVFEDSFIDLIPQRIQTIEKPAHAGNGRYSEVVSLAEKGFSDTEIAKKLNMGKGEIQLILGMQR